MDTFILYFQCVSFTMGTVLNIQSFTLGNFVNNFIESSHTNPEVQCALSLVYYCEVWHLFT